MSRFAVLMLSVTLFAASAAPPARADAPISADVVLNNRDRIYGKIVAHDEASLTVEDRKGEKHVIAWGDVQPRNAVKLRARLVDRKDAQQMLALGRFAWSVGEKADARPALAAAVKLDESLKEQVDQILATEPGSGAAGGSSAPTDAGGKPKYEKSTPEQDAAAMAAARKNAAEISEQLKLTFAEIETDHFIIFTDWDKREFNFLKKNLEDAYDAVSKQFEIPSRENIFVGKLPVFMFAKQRDFQNFALRYDGFQAPDGVAGYYHGRDDGMGHMAMWKPNIAKAGGDVRAAERFWAYVLTHEFTHAFIARYRTNRHVPTWLNEGVAEVIAQGQFRDPDSNRIAKAMMSHVPSINIVFAEGMKSGEWYPVMRTMVETLLAKDRRAFLTYFDAIKEGKDPQEALKEIYGWTYGDFEKAWRAYVSRL